MNRVQEKDVIRKLVQKLKKVRQGRALKANSARSLVLRQEDATMVDISATNHLEDAGEEQTERSQIYL